MKYRKKPVVIDAVQWTGQQIEGCTVIKAPHEPLRLCIPTLEGDMTAQLGDWIVTGVANERYSCKESIFRATYEPADEEAERSWAS